MLVGMKSEFDYGVAAFWRVKYCRDRQVAVRELTSVAVKLNGVGKLCRVHVLGLEIRFLSHSIPSQAWKTVLLGNCLPLQSNHTRLRNASAVPDPTSLCTSCN